MTGSGGAGRVINRDRGVRCSPRRSWLSGGLRFEAHGGDARRVPGRWQPTTSPPANGHTRDGQRGFQHESGAHAGSDDAFGNDAVGANLMVAPWLGRATTRFASTPTGRSRWPSPKCTAACVLDS